MGKLGKMKIINATSKHSGTIFFFHGVGDSADGLYEWVKCLVDFSFPHLKVIYPTAPIRAYTPFEGEQVNAWFNRLETNPKSPEHKETLDEICKEVKRLVEKEMNDHKISSNRIILGGFSMGGSLALHLGYRCLPNNGGVFALSSFLNENTDVYKTVKQNPEPPQLFMCHGERDTLVKEDWAKKTFENLKKAGVNGEYHSFKIAHELKKTEMKLLKEWISNRVPNNE